MPFQLCNKCKKPTFTGSLCDNCKKEEEKKESLKLKATKLLNALIHGPFHNFIANQTKTFSTEFFNGFLWAPIEYDGHTCQHWNSVRDLKIGDRVFNGRNGVIEGISIVTKEAVVKKFPENINDPKYQVDGWYVECESTRIFKPLELNNYMEERKNMLPITNSAFDKNGDFRKGYLFALTDEFADMLEKEINKFCK